MVTEKQVMDVLYQCFDPEIPVNIVDLGLIYNVEVTDDKVGIIMTLTTPGCPMHSQIAANVRTNVEQVDGVNEVEVKMVFDPRWNADMITPAGRQTLGLPEQ